MGLYSFDTSAFIEPWHRHYPIDIAPTLWDRLDALGSDGVILVQDQVHREIQRIDDGLKAWMDQRPHMISPTDVETQKELIKIMQSHPTLVGMAKQRSGADPWVIALAKVRGCEVVTYEPFDGKIKIPRVCADVGVRCLTFVEFLRQEKITLVTG